MTPVSPNPKTASRAGFALVIVLGFLVLLTVLVIAFFSSVTTDYVATKQYSNGAATKQLADSTVQVVLGQIKAATTGSSYTWASQPGMIRTYDDTGSAVSNYKLYSSGTMTVAGGLKASQVSDYDIAWSQKPAAWTDLNAPVTDAGGGVNFPIIDGNNIVPLAKDASGNTVPTYLGYDAINNQTGASGADGLPDVEGFAVDPSKVAFDPTAKPSARNTAVPVPVTWLYQLRDGTLIAPDAKSTTTATFQDAAAHPDVKNPIVGRVAFWTDDETSKVNINTACGDEWSPAAKVTPASTSVAGSTPYTPPGAFWDVPRAYTSYEYNSLALLQPAQHEYQRYPGHPATAYISAIFPNLTRDQLFNIIPRISGGGSQGGTTPGGTTLTPDADRLYASVDELLFKPTVAGTARDLNDATKTIFGKTTLERGKFFLTASSRAPEVNLFNKPRIAVWPVDRDVVVKQASGTLSPRGTAFDALIAFCAHLGPLGSGNDYFFQRSANGYLSQTQDYDLVTGTNNEQRNHLLYSYLQSLASAKIPGFGGSLATKFGSDSDQVLTEIFDYIRCVNPSDDNIAFLTSTNGNPTNGSNCYTPSETLTANILSGGYNGKVLTPQPYHSFIAPTRIGTTQGFGRSDTVSEVGLCFICSADGTSTSASPLYDPKKGPVRGDGGLTAVTNPPVATPSIPPVTVYSDFPPLKTPLPTAAQIAAHPFFSTAPGYLTVTSPGFGPTNWNTNLPTYDWSADSTGAQWTGVSPGQRRLQGILLLNPYTVSPGYSTMHMDVGFEVKGLEDISVVGPNGKIVIGFPADKTVVMANPTYRTPTFGVNYPFFTDSYLAPVRTLAENGTQKVGDVNTSPTVQDPRLGKIDATSLRFPPFRTYEFVSAPFTVSSTSPMLVSGGANAWIGIWHLSPADAAKGTNVTPTTATSALTQTIAVDFSKLAGSWPVPTLVTKLPGQMDNNQAGSRSVPSSMRNPAAAWDFSWKGVWGDYSLPGRFYNCVDLNGHDIEPLLLPNDVVRTMVPGYPTDAGPVSGDYRVLAAQNSVGSNVFVPHRLMLESPGKPMIHSFIDLEVNGWAFEAYLLQTDYGPATTQSAKFQGMPESPFGALMTSTPPNRALAAYTSLVPVKTGDFDNGTGTDMDGPYINKPDTGFQATSGSYVYPYFGHFADYSSASFFSPNRQIPSPGMFGSLPVGVLGQHPWQTLLFRPQPTHPDGVAVPDANATRTPGSSPYAGLAADHLIMDWFWMPVVEPYALSEPFSTAGKINMNYQLAPFTYITRATAVDALLKSQRQLAIPNLPASANWKVPVGYGTDVSNNTKPPSADYRSDLNLHVADGTLRQFDETFAAGELFRSATQICDIYLTPQDQKWLTNADAESFWSTHQLTGDNSRERPYANLYGCLTTKSNTYTVHFRAQSLQKAAGTPVDQWVNNRDAVTGDYRGSTLVERYVDASDTTLPDFAANPAASLDSFYKFRVVSNKKFAP